MRAKASAFNGNFLIALRRVASLRAVPRRDAERRVAERLSIDPYHCITESTQPTDLTSAALPRISNVIAVANGEFASRFNRLNERDACRGLPLTLSESTTTYRRNRGSRSQSILSLAVFSYSLAASVTFIIVTSKDRHRCPYSCP